MALLRTDMIAPSFPNPRLIVRKWQLGDNLLVHQAAETSAAAAAAAAAKKKGGSAAADSAAGSSRQPATSAVTVNTHQPTAAGMPSAADAYGTPQPQAHGRLLPEQTAPDWGLDSIDQETLPLDSLYEYDNQGIRYRHAKNRDVDALRRMKEVHECCWRAAIQCHAQPQFLCQHSAY